MRRAASPTTMPTTSVRRHDIANAAFAGDTLSRLTEGRRALILRACPVLTDDNGNPELKVPVNGI